MNENVYSLYDNNILEVIGIVITPLPYDVVEKAFFRLYVYAGCNDLTKFEEYLKEINPTTRVIETIDTIFFEG